MDKNKLISFLEDLLYVRLVEEKICDLYPEQEIRCPIHLSIGQEVTSVGVCANLTKKDLVFAGHRSHGPYLAKGGDLNKFFAELYGKITGCSGGRGGSMHLVDISKGFIGSTPIVSGIVPVSVGAAFSIYMKNLTDVVVVFIGDAVVEEGTFHESLNFSKLKNLPILFFCENNLYSVYTHIKERQPPRKIIDLIKGHGLDCYEVDGYNLSSVYETTKKAIEKIRDGNGPAFIEATTYRWKEHCGPNYDNHLGYRDKKEYLEWKKKDPIKKLKEKVINKKLITNKEFLVLEKKIIKKIDKAVAFAKESPFPNEDELYKNVYAK